eukprot:6609718-Alexandrium_andersonii.AAC.1
MGLQEAAEAAGMVLERSCDVFRILSDMAQSRTIEALENTRPALLWIAAFRPTTSRGNRREVKAAWMLAKLCR